MPNWCSNEVEIYGTKEDITKFVEECFTEHKGQSVLDFNKILPEPAIGSYKLPKKDGTHNDGVQTELLDAMPDWWHWRNENWGTKWNLVPNPKDDIYGYTIDIGGDSMSLSFDTAWSPPSGIHGEIVERYPSLDISWFYREDGMQFSGWLPYD
tara:strand:+ start:848 stop:1306 length:459 start_codon:yes stop_codon:yes gene_type:complete